MSVRPTTPGSTASARSALDAYTDEQIAMALARTPEESLLTLRANLAGRADADAMRVLRLVENELAARQPTRQPAGCFPRVSREDAALYYSLLRAAQSLASVRRNHNPVIEAVAAAGPELVMPSPLGTRVSPGGVVLALARGAETAAAYSSNQRVREEQALFEVCVQHCHGSRAAALELRERLRRIEALLDRDLNDCASNDGPRISARR